jgi:broad specificity phosphatase PhoE
MRRRTLIAWAAAALLTPASLTAQTARVVHVVRHFDTPAGERDPELTEVGTRRAQALVRWFAGKPLSAIYVTDWKRTRATVAPLVAARKLTPQVYDPATPAALIERVRAATGPVLIVGHSNTVPDIVAALGGDKPAPLTHSDFGDVWTMSATGTGRDRVEP